MTPVTPMRYLSPREVGDVLGISGDTIRRLIKSHEIDAIRMPPGNFYKIPAAEVLRYANEHNIPLVESNRKLLEEMVPEEYREANTA